MICECDARHELVYDENGDFMEDRDLGMPVRNSDHYIEEDDKVDKLAVPSRDLAEEIIQKLADGDLDGLDEAAAEYDVAEVV
jgi:hypothetical protein